MELLSYFRKNLNESESFGKFELRATPCADLYFGKNKIGIEPKIITPIECFCICLLGTADHLVIRPYVPEIVRVYQSPWAIKNSAAKKTDDSFARITADEIGMENTKDLIELLSSQASSHAYLSSIEGKCEDLLTFSSDAPPGELYTEISKLYSYTKPIQMILEEAIKY